MATKHVKRRNGARLPVPAAWNPDFAEDRLRRRRVRARKLGESADFLTFRRGKSVETARKAGSSKSPSPMPEDLFNSKENVLEAAAPPPPTDRLEIPGRPAVQRNRPASTMNARVLMKRNAQKWFKRVVEQKGVSGLKAEFEALQPTPVDPALATAFHRNAPRNRYRDVVCLDETRVLLEGGRQDYIHANYVAAPMNERRFVCTQGPLENTVADFWAMIVQERTLELPKECNQGITIKVRGLEIVTGSKKFFCDHYQVMDWPDRGILPADLTLVHLLNAVRLSRQPIVVHCSAGIGRSATVIMIEELMELFEGGESFEDSAELLEELRDQRAHSIQNSNQYLFVHRVFLEFLYRQKVFNPDQTPLIRKFVRDYLRETKETQ
ncbi:hypothetical protein M3Y99_01594600 [Aphelenchoides fujianensis]|nr:hypothetical protein M3Y99_01594600 [Aphelenchoides fujianensis]